MIAQAPDEQARHAGPLVPSTDNTPAPIASPWADRLRHAAIILLAAAIALVALAAFGEISGAAAGAVFVCIAAASLVPWRLHSTVSAREETHGVSPVETPVVRAIVAGMPDPAVLLDRAGRVLHLNDAAEQIAPALRVRELAQFALRNPEIVTALREAIATAEPRRVSYLDHAPIERWMELIITPVQVPTAFDGTDQCMLMTFHDLTPLRRVEEMRVDFVANASHELRTPLAALSGFIDTLQGPARDDAKARERFLGIMQAQATRMARLIDDLLSLSRVELSVHVRPDTQIDLAPLIKQVADGLEPLAKERQVAIEIELPEAPAVIAGDREELLRVFENLIENALKYGASGGRVAVSVGSVPSSDGGVEYRVAVRDFGPGISPEHLPRLTERFYRVDVGDSRSQGGTGLGLSLVKHIVNRHRGRLLIESVMKNGATFTVCFPPEKPRVRAEN
ncbi:two-component sensor histidine kinase [Rhodopseudomonas palustris]|uniref:histidine kinase n=1 Tax=Rhodopseudomonas palustris (strain BisB5) TaxID=316057 RepID=Q13CR4_RHOPS|nr:histidine kinase [Rhodopseudomonas palustris BisB5]MBB1090689.1 two-component sensor histidine kinase [Rhodopseudomonas palustris]